MHSQIKAAIAIAACASVFCAAEGVGAQEGALASKPAEKAQKAETPEPAAKPAIAKGVVSADKLNVRVLPGLGHTVVAVLAQGDMVDIRALNGDWIEIAIPPSAAVWVASSFVDKGAVVKKAHLRSGPGVAYESFGVAEPGEKVDIIDSSKDHWFKIAPKARLSAYAYANMVKIDPEGKKRLMDAAPKQEPQSSSQETPSLDPQGSPQKDEPQEVQDAFAKSGVVEGILLPVKDGKGLATHALAVMVNGDYHPVCYLHSASFNLNLWERRKVRVKGTQRWVENWRRPLVEIELITPIWQ